jgi:hypothetical protein
MTALKHKGSEPLSGSKDISLMQLSSIKFASLGDKEISNVSIKKDEGVDE